ncbi:MAG: phosphoribosylanthranilate isomerase, partial [Rickettsiales bacterium]|nr:phosphoribosylanthranilate isomerase [Rickettsiales bacterium]
DAASLSAAVEAGANYVGFVYYPASPRHISLENAAALKEGLRVRCVSVVVDADDTLLTKIRDMLAPYAVQLHGKESPARVADVRARFPEMKVIKGVSIRDAADVAKAAAYRDVADMLLLDAKAPPGSLPGGNGVSFDWALLRGWDIGVKWALSGGLNVRNVGAAIAETGAKFVDVSSGVETTAGVKDAALIHEFVKAVRAHEQA